MNMADMKIDEEKLDKVVGGATNNVSETCKTKLSPCPRCKKDTIFYLYTGGRAVCSECEYEKFM